MDIAVLNTCALSGLDAPTVQCEVHISAGLPAFNIVGLPDTGIRESRERVRSAIISAGYKFPAGRITANLSPGNLPKESSRFDLAIALGILLATRQLTISDTWLSRALPRLFFMGELSLTGALIPIKSSLVMALSIYKRKHDAVLVMPGSSASQAAMVEGLTVFEANTLHDVCLFLQQTHELRRAQASDNDTPPSVAGLCMSDVRGQPLAVKAMEIAAAGGHNLILRGSPGIGKSMLAQRLPGIMPQLDNISRLEVAAMHSLADESDEHIHSPAAPFRAPHHTISRSALIGGGARPRPGEVSLAHHGVLFLDEMLEFERRSLESLREPLETGMVNIARVRGSHAFPARFQLIGAMNPCPCGYHGHPSRSCECSPEQIRKYQRRLSGPLLDRIDIVLNLPALEHNWIDAQPAETSEVIRQRVAACRDLQMQRQGKLNARLSNSEVEEICIMAPSVSKLLTRQIRQHSWSGRVTQRVLKLSRTIADLAQAEQIDVSHLAQAISLKAG